MKKIGILDYCVFSNKVHLKNILENLMCKVEYVNDARKINDYDILICPGLGSFEKSINLLKKKEFHKAIQDMHPNRKFLGICLGFQMLFQTGNENNIKTNGLGIIKGHVRKIIGEKPKIGFFETSFKNTNLFKNIKNPAEFYYLHSYGVRSNKDTSEVGLIKYKKIFYKSCIRYKNYIGVQFHPEASGKNGINFFKNIINE